MPLKILATKKILYSSSDDESSTVTNSRGLGISLVNTSKKIDRKHFLFVQFPPIKCTYQGKWSYSDSPLETLHFENLSKLFLVP